MLERAGSQAGDSADANAPLTSPQRRGLLGATPHQAIATERQLASHRRRHPTRFVQEASKATKALNKHPNQSDHSYLIETKSIRMAIKLFRQYQSIQRKLASTSQKL